MAAVPDHDTAGAVLALGNFAFEAAVVEGMILHLYGEAAVFGVQARFLRHCPAFQHAVVLEPEVVVQPRRVVPLHDVLQAAPARVPCAFRFWRAREIALVVVTHELASRGGLASRSGFCVSS